MSDSKRVASVLHVLWSAEVGGIERIVLVLAREQLARGWDVNVLFGRLRGEWLSRFEDVSNVHGLMLRKWWMVSPRTLGTVLSIMRHHDVIHMHVTNPLFMLCAALAKRPVVHTIHGGKGINAPLDRSMKLYNRLVSIYIRNRSVHLVANSYWTAQRAERIYVLGKKPVDVIYNGINIGEHASSIERDRTLGKAFTIGTLSRLTKNKHLDRLLRAFALSALRETNVRLMIGGDGRYRNEIDALVDEVGIRAQTVMLGHVDDVAGFFDKITIAVFPSRWEPFGLVAIEAMSRGVPVLVFQDAGGMVELVENVCPANVVSDEKLLARRLEFYLSNPPTDVECEEWRRQAAKYSPARMEQQYAALYERCGGNQGKFVKPSSVEHRWLV